MVQVVENVETSFPTNVTPSFTPSKEVHWIKPASPTRLDGCLTMPLPGMDQIFFPIDCVWLLPGHLSVSRLKEAISRVLAAYPHAAGRLTKGSGGKWKFLLNKSAVPLIVETRSGPPPSDEQLLEGDPTVLDPFPYAFRPPPDMAEHALVKWKLTVYPDTHQSVFAIHACHALGDGVTISRMQRTLSDFYQGLPASEPLPTYEKYFSVPRPLSREVFAKTLERVPNLREDYDPPTLLKMWTETKDRTDRVDIIFSKKQLRLLQEKASKEGKARLSGGDALVAYMISVFNRTYPKVDGQAPFNQLMNVVQYRGRTAPKQSTYDDAYELPTVSSAGNVLFHSVSPPLPESSLRSLGSMALAVRETIRTTQEYGFLRDAVALCEERYEQMGISGTMPWMNPSERAIGANLLHKAPIQSSHFGFGTHRTKFFTFPANEHYLRVFPPNPVPLTHPDGSLVIDATTGEQMWQDRQGGAHAFFRVRKGLKQKMLDIVEADMAALESGAQEKAAQAQNAAQRPLKARL